MLEAASRDKTDDEADPLVLVSGGICTFVPLAPMIVDGSWVGLTRRIM
jgi:hypothetical protein